MLFSFDWIKDYLEYDLKPEEAAKLLTRHALAVESIEERGGETIFEIEVLPNRGADCLSHFGIARELNALGAFERRPRKKAKHKSQNFLPKADKNLAQVKIQDPADCPRYALGYLEGVKVTDSPAWLKKRLKALGVVPINNIVDAANYAMLDMGQPLHAFDAEALKNTQGEIKIDVRKAQGKEKVDTLDLKTYDVPKGTLLIASGQKVLALAGIKGAVQGSIQSSTRNILIEAANFNARLVYQGSKDLNLKTDASTRFSHNLDPGLVMVGLNRAIELILKVAGGRAVALKDEYPKPSRPVKLSFSFAHVANMAGLEIKAATAKHALTCLGFKVNPKDQIWQVEAPSYRRDIKIYPDVVEEILRLYGYENIPAILPKTIYNFAAHTETIQSKLALRKVFTGLGFDELQTYSLVPQSDLEWCQVPPEQQRLLKIKNPLSLDRAFLRASILPGLIKAAQLNRRFGAADLKLMELGHVFSPSRPGELPKELECMAGVLLGGLTKASIYPQGVEFYTLKGLLAGFFNEVGLNEVTYEPVEIPARIWHIGRVAKLSYNGAAFGFVGELSPSLTKDLKFTDRLVLFEMQLEPLIQALGQERQYQAPPKYPATLRDISLVVPKGVSVAKVIKVMRDIGGAPVVGSQLFDWYEGENLPAGTKSLAFHITYRSPSRTMTDKEVDKIHKMISIALQQEVRATIR